MKDAAIIPWIVTGESIGKDSDNYDVLDPQSIQYIGRWDEGKSFEVVPDDTGRIPPPSEWGDVGKEDIRFAAERVTPEQPDSDQFIKDIRTFKRTVSGAVGKDVAKQGFRSLSRKQRAQERAQIRGLRLDLTEKAHAALVALKATVEDARTDIAAKQRAIEDFVKENLPKDLQPIAFKAIRSIINVKNQWTKNAEKVRDRRFDRAVAMLETFTAATNEKADMRDAIIALHKAVGKVEKLGAHFSADRKATVKSLIGEFTFKRIQDDEALRAAIEELRQEGSESSGVSEEELAELSRLMPKNVRDMTPDELRYMAWMLTQATSEQIEAHKAAHRERQQRAVKSATNIVGGITRRKHIDLTKQVPDKAGGFFRHYFAKFLLSRTVAYMIDGGQEHGPAGEAFVWSFFRGTKGAYTVRFAASDALKERMGEVDPQTMQRPIEGRRNIPASQQGKTTRYELENGGTLDLYDGERITVYLSSLNQQNVKHFVDGGLVFQGSEETIPIKLSAMDIAVIASDVATDPKLKKIADAYHHVFNVVLKHFLNERSMSMHAEEIADVLDYLPIITSAIWRRYGASLDSEDVSPGDIQNIVRMAIESMGPLQRRLPGAKSPVVLYDVFTLGERSAKVASLYYGYAEPVDIVKRIRQPLVDKDKNVTGSVEAAVKRAYGTHFWDALVDVARSFETATQTSKTERQLNRGLNTLTKATLAYNVPVVAIQPVSYLTALPYMGVRAWLRGAASFAASWEKMNPHSVMIRMRSRGRVSIAAGEVIKPHIHGMGERGMRPILWGDRQSVGRIWNGVLWDERRKTPNATETEIMARVAERVDDINWLTQPTFEAETRSQMQREKGIGLRALMRFSSQRTKLFDMFTRAIYDYATGKANVGRTLTILGALLASQAIVAALKAKAGTLLRRRDEDKEDEYFWRALVSTLASFGGRGTELIADVMNAVKSGYRMQDPFFQILQDSGKLVYDATTGTWKAATGTYKERKKAKRTLLRAGERGLRTFGTVSGTGVHNIIEPVKALVEWFKALSEPPKRSLRRK